MSKIDLILNDFYKRHCLTRASFDDILSGNPNEQVEYTPNETIAKNYDTYPEKYNIIFACLHDKINRLMDFMKYKAGGNGHFNASESRDLIEIIESIRELQAVLLKIGIEIHVDSSYDEWLKSCSEFLASTQGSTIPNDLKIPTLIKYDPIFTIHNFVDIERLKKLGIVFDSEYQTRQAKELVFMVEKDQVRAIGIAKEYIEACLQTILNGLTDLDLDKADISQLLSEARKVFKLNKSDNLAVKKIISGVSNTSIGIAELRNRKGSGHSHTSKVSPPTKTEARLAVDAAITVVNFFWSLSKKK